MVSWLVRWTSRDIVARIPLKVETLIVIKERHCVLRQVHLFDRLKITDKKFYFRHLEFGVQSLSFNHLG